MSARAVSLAIATALVLLTRQSAADEGHWATEAQIGIMVIGLKNPTGGVMPTLAAGYSWPLGPRSSFGFGADLGAFSFTSAHYFGFLGGITAHIGGKPWSAPVALDIMVMADGGRVPICSTWKRPSCPRWWVISPGLKTSAAFEMESGLSIGIFAATHPFNTPMALTLSIEAGASVGWRFGLR